MRDLTTSKVAPLKAAHEKDELELIPPKVKCMQKIKEANLICSRTAAFLRSWTAPEWVPAHIPNVPREKVKLASLPTPMEPWDFCSFKAANPGVELFIKRDDQTGASLTGNKVRKLEFLLGDALRYGSDTVISCGMATSNHCRSTAVACAKLGLKCHLLLTNLGTDINFDSGNVQLAAAAGAHMYQVDADAVDEKMDKLAKMLTMQGAKPYLIPRGGSNEVSIWGYIEAWREMESQEYFSEVTDIVVVSGSGGTGLDLALANYWTGSTKKVHGIRTWGDSKYFYNHAKMTLEDAGIFDIEPRDIIDVIDGHVGEGYGMSDEKLRNFCIKSASESGIILDRVYTGKAMYGLMHEVQSNPKRFQGKKILFVHTGGIYGFLDRSMDQDLAKYNPIKMNFFDNNN